MTCESAIGSRHGKCCLQAGENDEEQLNDCDGIHIARSGDQFSGLLPALSCLNAVGYATAASQFCGTFDGIF